MKDIVTGAMLAVLMAVLLREAGKLPMPRYEPLGSIFLAMVIPALILVFSLALIAKGMWKRRDDVGVSPKSKLASPTNVRFAATLATGFAWLAAMQLSVSFGTATFGFVLACALVLGARRTPAALGITLCVASALSFGAEFLFSRYLDVALP